MPLKSQSFIYNNGITFNQNGRSLKYPLAGGLNNPQFSSIDINQDGIKDIFMFDRSGNKPLVLINNGGEDEINYFYWHDYEKVFPPLFDWAVLLDYNCDGLEDIITGFENGVKTYLASYDGSNFSYAVDVDQLSFSEAGFTFFVAVGVIDVPGFADINFDGDIDMLTFNMAGGIVDYYENRQIEDGLPCGTWALEHVNSCWGNFYECGITYSVDLNQECKGITSLKDGVHAGSSFMLFDEDADNDMDVVLGDLAFNNLNKLINGGDNTYANITEQDTTFPSYDNPYDIPIFPAAFLMDVNNDNKKDMLVAPNNINQSENFKNVWYYKNVSPDETYVFDYQQDSLFVSEIVDLGSGAYPVYFDYNYDGLLDLVIGNKGYFNTGDYDGMLALFENTGTINQAAFTLVTRDFGGLSAFGFNYLTPTFGDLDGDGDEDLLVGEEEGFLHYFKNIGPPDGPASFVLQTPNYQGIDYGQNSTPQLIDVDEDGMLDLILGEKNGNLNYLLNTGTAAAPIFTIQNEFWGNVDVRAPFQVFGSSTPYLYKNVAGDFELYVGCEDGTIYLYTLGDDLTAPFTKITAAFNNIDEGNFSAIAIADIDNDSYPDIVTGNLRGGITIYKNENATTIFNQNQIDHHLTIFPNPTSSNVTISTANYWEFEQVKIYSLEGRLVKIYSFGKSSLQTINIADLQNGFYTIAISNSKGEVAITKCIKR